MSSGKCFSEYECKYMKITDYDSAITYLYSLELFGIKLGLDNIRRILDKLGKPEAGLKFVHVAGTNGKGTVCAMLASVLAKAGLGAGLYTSPHLVDFEERIVINGERISKDRVVELTQKLQQIALEIEEETEAHPTYFEITTAMAIKYFQQENVDIVILEVGMGGRFDATNVVTPVLSIINDISLDHMEYLGDSIEKIAYEKAGIIKENVPVIVGDLSLNASEVIGTTAMEKNADIFVLGKDFHYELKSADRKGLLVNVKLSEGCFTLFEKEYLPLDEMKTDYSNVIVPLLGEFQAKNTAMAIAALIMLRQYDLEISYDAIYQGIAEVKWPARIQVMQEHPTVILDSSHNLKSIQNLIDTLKKYFDYRELILVIGVVSDKDRMPMIEALTALKPHVVAVKPETPRALDPGVLQQDFNKYGIGVDVVPDILEGVKHALDLAKPEDLVVITGSFYTAGTAMEHWNSE